MSDTIEDIVKEVRGMYGFRAPEKAERLARLLHKNQTYGEATYADGHLQKVVNLIVGELAGSHYEYRDLVLAIAWLHDAIEDTEATYETISAIFGHNVAIGVQNLSDAPGKNRRERKLKSYYRIRISPESVMIKVADRLVNMRNCDATNKSLLEMYMKEHDTFMAALWHPSQSYQAWWEEMEAIVERNRT